LTILQPAGAGCAVCGAVCLSTDRYHRTAIFSASQTFTGNADRQQPPINLLTWLAKRNLQSRNRTYNVTCTGMLVLF
jgi:hypothetical protein